MIKGMRFMALVAVLLALAAPALAEDAVSSASAVDFYADNALTGNELMDAINGFSGFYLICTVNPDGTPNAGYFIYSCLEQEGKYYLQMGLSENQTRQNLLANNEAVAVYAAAPEEGAKPYAVSGARMRIVRVTDEALLKALNPQNSEATLFFEIVQVRPLG